MAQEKASTVFHQQATPFKDFVAHLAPGDVSDLQRLAEELALRLEHFTRGCEAEGIPPVQIRPARLVLAALADQMVRQHRRIDLVAWSGLARQKLFDGRSITKNDIAQFSEIAQKQGPDFAQLATFLDDCQRHLTDVQAIRMRPRSAFRVGTLVAMLILTIGGLVSYVTYLEGRFHRQALAAYVDLETDLLTQMSGQSDQVVNVLNALSTDLVHVRDAVTQAPLRGVITLPFADAVGRAEER